MKARIKNPFLVPALVAGLGLIVMGRVTAQTFTNLHSFATLNEGSGPQARLMLSANALYGTAQTGGPTGYGTLFKVNTDGTGFTNLHTFSSTSTNGTFPTSSLILSSNRLYGTARGGGAGFGAVFALNPDGTGYTNLYNFAGSSGGSTPAAGLVLSSNTFFGTTIAGGSSSKGLVFRVNTDGTGFANLHTFFGVSDGANPYGELVLSSNTLYGTANTGGSSGNGTVFRVNTDGTSFTNLHNFTATSLSTNSDGANPYAGLVLSGNILYGAAYQGGSSGNGTLFAVKTDGTGFTNLHNFTTNGANPYADLFLAGNTLYETTRNGGTSGYGTVFRVNTDGTGYTNLHNFTALISSTNSDGANPFAGLILSGNTMYGAARSGGNFGSGTVFSLSLGPVSAPSPQLTIIRSGANVVLTWPTNAAGFTLQSTTNLVSPAVWITNSPAPVVVNGQNTVTNPIAGARKFYRLIQ